MIRLGNILPIVLLLVIIDQQSALAQDHRRIEKENSRRDSQFEDHKKEEQKKNGRAKAKRNKEAERRDVEESHRKAVESINNDKGHRRDSRDAHNGNKRDHRDTRNNRRDHQDTRNSHRSHYRESHKGLRNIRRGGSLYIYIDRSHRHVSGYEYDHYHEYETTHFGDDFSRDGRTVTTTSSRTTNNDNFEDYDDFEDDEILDSSYYIGGITYSSLGLSTTSNTSSERDFRKTVGFDGFDSDRRAVIGPISSNVGIVFGGLYNIGGSSFLGFEISYIDFEEYEYSVEERGRTSGALIRSNSTSERELLSYSLIGGSYFGSRNRLFGMLTLHNVTNEFSLSTSVPSVPSLALFASSTFSYSFTSVGLGYARLLGDKVSYTVVLHINDGDVDSRDGDGETYLSHSFSFEF